MPGTGILKKAYLQTWPLIGIQEPGFTSLTDQMAHFAQIVWFLLNTCFSFGSLEFLQCVRQRVPTDQPPRITLGTESLRNFPGQKHHTYVAAFLLLEKNVLCVTSHGRE